VSLTQLLELQLTAMQVPDASPSTSVETSGKNPGLIGNGASTLGQPPRAASPAQQLQVIPGEPSELVINLHNTSRSSLFLQFQVSGNFPPHWCRLGTEGHELPAKSRMEAVLHFNIDPNFFEDRQALRLTPPTHTKKSLNIDYTGQIQVFTSTINSARTSTATSTNNNTLIATRPFSLHIRPHSRYLKFLPAVYHEVDFIGRFLKLFETSFDPDVQTLNALWAYLDPLTAPESMLPFLAQWVGWPSNIPWSIAQQRRLIGRAIEIYRWRGTRRGLRLYLHLYTGLPLDDDPDTPESEKHISIVETFSRGLLLGKSRLGQDSILGGGRPYHFTVQIRSDRPLDETLIRSIIEQEKPAFCTYDCFIERLSAPAPRRRSSPPSARPPSRI